MRYLYVFLGLVLVIGGFLAGFKFGLFLFPEEKNPIEKNNPPTIASDSQTNNLQPTPPKNFCSDEIKFINEDDKKFCFQKSKLTEPRGIEVDLTNSKALIYDNGKLIKIFPLSYQSPENKWYEAPTGYFRAGVKHEKHLSSLFPVIMPYAVQFYEDFFIHGIPYYQDGADVSSEFTGGCLRFANNSAKEIYDFIKTGDPIVIYKSFADLEIKPEFQPPVDLENFFIERRFLNPYRQFQLFGGTDALEEDYYQHTGVDLRPMTDDSRQIQVYAIYDGKIAKIQLNNGNDHGLGNTVIIEHQINNEKIYSLYAHLSLISSELKEGDIIKKGEIIGEVGNSGFGCDNYWRIGKDGCDSQMPNDTHLHFEIKKAPVLENPEAGKVCENEINGPKRFCYGYTPDYPQKYGYLNPMEFLFKYRDAKNANACEFCER